MINTTQMVYLVELILGYLEVENIPKAKSHLEVLQSMLTETVPEKSEVGGISADVDNPDCPYRNPNCPTCSKPKAKEPIEKIDWPEFKYGFESSNAWDWLNNFRKTVNEMIDAVNELRRAK